MVNFRANVLVVFRVVYLWSKSSPSSRSCDKFVFGCCRLAELTTMNDDEGIDFQRLEKELVLAVEADAKYDRENSAKFRAVEQKVGCYEEFRDIVSAAHLKPLDRKDITGWLK